MLSIGVLAQGVTIWSDFVHQDFSLGRLSNIDHFLHHIVGILIFHHLVQWTLSSVMKININSEKTETIGNNEESGLKFFEKLHYPQIHITLNERNFCCKLGKN